MTDLPKAPTVADARSSLEQAREMLQRARYMWLKAQESLEEARRMRANLHAHIEELARRGPLRPQFISTLLSGILDAVIEGTDADMGNIQTCDPKTGTLHIRVHRGFHEPFLQFFDSVEADHAACGTALKLSGRVVVPDIVESSIFRGTHLLEVMLDAGIRAVQSTPLIGKSLYVRGMLSTHYRSIAQPGKKDLLLIDYFAAWAADILEAEVHAARSHARSSLPEGCKSVTPEAVLPSPDD